MVGTWDNLCVHQVQQSVHNGGYSAQLKCRDDIALPVPAGGGEPVPKHRCAADGSTRWHLQVLKEYFRELEEESIRDNFVITYELMDEMMDFGYPQISEAKILREYITQVSSDLLYSIMHCQMAIYLTDILTYRKRINWRL